jgi:hypothetical protein
MVIKDEEELRRRIEEGWWLSRDSAGVKLKDPRTGRSERVAKELEPLAIELHEGRRSAGGQGPQEVPATEEDVRQIVGLIRQRVDPRAPILQKLVENTAFWQRVTIELGARLLPELLPIIDAEDMDQGHPERTVEALVRAFKRVKDAYAGFMAVSLMIAIEACARARPELREALRRKGLCPWDAFMEHAEGKGRWGPPQAMRASLAAP